MRLELSERIGRCELICGLVLVLWVAAGRHAVMAEEGVTYFVGEGRISPSADVPKAGARVLQGANQKGPAPLPLLPAIGISKRAIDDERLRAVLVGHRLAVTSATFSPDAQQIVTASFDGTARVWNATTGAELAVFKGHTAVVRSAAFSPDGQRIVTGSVDGTARLWDARTDTIVAVLRAHNGAVRSAAF